MRRFIARLLVGAWTVSISRIATIVRFSKHFLRRFSCPDNVLSTWCGDLRDSEGKLMLDANGKAQSKCVAQNAASTCPPIPNLAAKAVPKVQSIPVNAAAAVTALSSDNEPIATLDIPANTVSDVSFVVSPVADSVYQAGAFAALFSAGKLRSPLVSISPNAIVDTRGGGITLSLAVDIPAASCVNASSNMKVCLQCWYDACNA